MKHTLFLWFTGLLLVFLQALPWNFLFPELAMLNLSFVVVVMAGFRDMSASSCLIAFVLGYVLESLSGSPRGLISLTNLLVLVIIGPWAGASFLKGCPRRCWRSFFSMAQWIWRSWLRPA
jgi:hypothetical protein